MKGQLPVKVVTNGIGTVLLTCSFNLADGQEDFNHFWNFFISFAKHCAQCVGAGFVHRQDRHSRLL